MTDMKLSEAVGNLFAALIQPRATHRAAEWGRIETELIAVTGSPEQALVMAQCAVEAAKAGVGSPEELVQIIRRGHVSHLHHMHDLYTLRRSIEGMEERA